MTKTTRQSNHPFRQPGSLNNGQIGFILSYGHFRGELLLGVLVLSAEQVG